MLTTPRPSAHAALARRLVTSIDARNLLSQLEREPDSIRVFDLRDAEDYERAHVQGAVRLDRERVSRCRRLQKIRVNVLYGSDSSDDAPYLVAWRLADKGFPAVVLEGGFAAWFDFVQQDEAAETSAVFAIVRLEGVTT